jgi:hypothetical protein
LDAARDSTCPDRRSTDIKYEDLAWSNRALEFIVSTHR